LLSKEAVVYTDDLGTKSTESLDIPAGMADLVSQYRHDLIEAVADFDDSVMHKYLEEQDITEEEIKEALRAGTVKGVLVPVLCGAALRNRGVQPILDAVVDYLPSPADVPAVEGKNPKTGALEVREHDDNEPFSALAFKIQMDPQGVGKLTFFRVYSGRLKAGSSVLNVTSGRRERVGRILRMHAMRREDVDEVFTGDIAAAVGLKQTSTGDTLAYKEAIRRPAHGTGRFVRQTGGKGQFGHVELDIEPGERGSGFVFEDRISQGRIPREFIPAVHKGVAEALGSGVVAGYPVIDVK